MKFHVINELSDVVGLLRGIKSASPMKIGELLQAHGLVDEQQIRSILREQKLVTRQRFGQIAIEKGWLNQEQVNVAMALKLGIPIVKITTYRFTEQALKTLPVDVIKKCRVMPLGEINGRLVVATDCPFDGQVIETLRFNAKTPVDIVFASSEEISAIAQRYLYGATLPAFSSMEAGQDDHAEKAAQERPIVQLLNSLIDQAVAKRASDINIRPCADVVRVYYRLDGVMTFIREVNPSLLAGLISRIKIIGKMNIAERRLPQDGHAVVDAGSRVIDLRISIIPTLRGESAVIRVLDKSKGLLSLESLGMDEDSVAKLKGMAQRHQGMVLVTGPTGAGKSTTLYSLIKQVQHENRHVLTIEDPVEYEIEGVEQVQVMPQRGLDFAAALRQFLRHDPDVIMVGEIRDEETAQIANKAALTGHLVLSTLHTRDAVSTVQRLCDMGVEPYLLAATLNGVVAQRLVRKICPHCRERDTSSAHRQQEDNGVFFRGKGCVHCHFTGYGGRLGVTEVLVITPEMVELIASQASRAQMLVLAQHQGMIRLHERAMQLARQGETTLEEALALRVE